MQTKYKKYKKYKNKARISGNYSTIVNQKKRFRSSGTMSHVVTTLLIAFSVVEALVEAQSQAMSEDGWALPSPTLWSGAKCDMDTVDASSMAPEALYSLFRSNYYKKKPLMVKKAFPEMPAMKQWTRPFFTGDYGRMTCHAGVDRRDPGHTGDGSTVSGTAPQNRGPVMEV